MKISKPTTSARTGLLLLLSLFGTQVSAQPYNRWRQAPLPPEPPKWSLELKAGNFTPETESLTTFFDAADVRQNGLAVGYKVLRTVELGIELGNMKERGHTSLPIDPDETLAATAAPGEDPADATYRLRTAHLYLVLRGIWGEDQIGVPYIGIAKSRSKYELNIDDVPDISGTVDGSQRRYGLQILIDRADSSAAAEMTREYGINNMYIYFEKQELEAKVNGVDLGGETKFIGFLFEF